MRRVPCLLMALAVLGGGVGRAAMNSDGGLSASEATHVRDHLLAVDPEVLRARMEEARLNKNAEVRRIMSVPPADFAHYANPPGLQQTRPLRERMMTPHDPLTKTVVKIVLFISLGTLILSFVAFRLSHTPQKK